MASSSKKKSETKTVPTNPGPEAPATPASASAMAAATAEPDHHATTIEPGEAGQSAAGAVVGLDAFVAGNEAILESIAALNSEVTDFGSQRLNANLKHRESLMDCHSAEEALRLQSDFVAVTAQDYLEQTGNVMKIMTDMTFNCWSRFEKQSQEVLVNLDKITRS